MRKLLLLLPLCVSGFFVRAQKKKPLDPSVYDNWQSIGERTFSPDGRYLVYTVMAQEGDGRLVVRSISGSYIKEIPRGAEAGITADSRFVVFRIKPFFKDTREAKIRKKKPEEMPKDSLGWIELGTDRLVTIARVKSYALPEKNGQWLAYLMEKPEPAGEDAYNSVMAAAKYLSRFAWVDTTKMGLQGHSWGGYQVAYLVTRMHSFAAAEAGAPVANMTSAYGGIRWESGISRQFQYEHSQSRLGASLWEKPELYIRNSPLFNADKVTTPLLMMANDADGAVPWYQGIEYFSALRRLGKKVWMMEYNGEGHGLTERRDRKDWSMRLSQFFDFYLKDAQAPRWMTEGVPATMKGIDWGDWERIESFII